MQLSCPESDDPSGCFMLPFNIALLVSPYVLKVESFNVEELTVPTLASLGI